MPRKVDMEGAVSVELSVTSPKAFAISNEVHWQQGAR
jgi:hypothetical protein